MNYKRLFAALLTGAMLLSFAGCAAGLEPRQEEAQYQVADEPASELFADTMAMESPAIDAEISLPGGVQAAQMAARAKTAPDEIRAVWISYLEMAALLTGKSERDFTKNMETAFDNVQEYGLNTVIVQVRPFGDALYDSDYFPWSYIITGTEGKDPGFDPLEIMVDLAKERGLRIEAWLNPYRVRAKDNNKPLSSDNRAKKWLASGKQSAVNYNGVISYNPASADARKLIVNGAVEIVQKYDVDGIHIDDYFYPTTDAAFDKYYYDAYKAKGGKMALADWRRSNVEKLIKEMYAAIKAEDRNVLFGIAPQSSIDNNYNAQYLDVEKIAGNAGYCDYICPQIYFGYKNEVQPYLETLKKWNSMVEDSPVKLYVGLAVYKCGGVDTWAKSGKNEWVNNSDLLKRMVQDGRRMSGYEGFVLYRYDSVFKPEAAVKTQVQKENRNLRSIL